MAPTKEELKRREDDAAHQLQQAAEVAADAERLRREEEERRNLTNRGQRIQEEILQIKMGDQNVLTTPQQNILVAKALCDMIKPMLAEDHTATPIVTRIKQWWRQQLFSTTKKATKSFRSVGLPPVDS